MFAVDSHVKTITFSYGSEVEALLELSPLASLPALGQRIEFDGDHYEVTEIVKVSNDAMTGTRILARLLTAPSH